MGTEPKPHVLRLSERERREVQALTDRQQRAYKNLRESEVPHTVALAHAREH